MGTRIEAVTTARGGRWWGRSARRLADRVGRTALEQAGIRPDDVDLLINTGLYHDHNLGEPALAAMIQEDIGANPEDPHEGGHGTFSFDIANGACGMLTALQVADGFLRAGTIDHALIVAADAHPGRGLATHFPFGSTAGALVCGHDPAPGGFAGFRFVNDPDDDQFTARVRFEHGHNVLTIDERAEFASRAAALAAKAAWELLAERDLTPDALDLVIANASTVLFVDALAVGLGLDPRLLTTPDDNCRAHTAGLAFALAAAKDTGSFVAPSNVLLISAGAGLTAGAALLLEPTGGQR